MGWFPFGFRHRRGPRDADLRHLHVVLYTRRGCHLCDDAHGLLQNEQRRYAFDLQVIDIDSDPDLVRRHSGEVPVVSVAGEIRFHGAVNAVLLTRLLVAEARRAGAERSRGRRR